MITIENLEVLFEAERQKDEARFAELFDWHIARHEQAKQSARRAAEQSAADRSLNARSLW